MPQAVLEFVKCHCSASMYIGRCSCKSADLPCTNECEGNELYLNPFKYNRVENTSSSENESDADTLLSYNVD